MVSTPADKVVGTHVKSWSDVQCKVCQSVTNRTAQGTHRGLRGKGRSGRLRSTNRVSTLRWWPAKVRDPDQWFGGSAVKRTIGSSRSYRCSNPSHGQGEGEHSEVKCSVVKAKEEFGSGAGASGRPATVQRRGLI